MAFEKTNTVAEGASWADFQARGMSDKATLSEYDKALELYGIKL